MKKQKRKRIWTAAMLLTIGTLFVSGSERLSAQEAVPEELPVWFFHDTACGNCDGTEEFLKIVSEEIAAYKELCPYELKMYNIFKSDGYTSMQSVLEEYEINPDEISFPAMLINGTVYEGLDQIEAGLKQEYVSAVGSSALYFYRSDCQECIDTEPFMDSLPETVIIEEKEVPFYLTSLNSREGDNGALIRELFAEYEVPEEDQMVPFVFLADTYLAGQEEIEENLLPLLEHGHGMAMEVTYAESISEEER